MFLKRYKLDNFKLDRTVLTKYQILATFGWELSKLLPAGLLGINLMNNEIEIIIKKSKMYPVFLFLEKYTWTQFKVLSDIIAIDYPGRVNRFDVIYQLLSIRYNIRLNVLVSTDELTPLSSITEIFKGASWYEREVWDLYGIFFQGHPDLRRILTDYGFIGHPFRKDFPVSGHVEMRYDAKLKRCVYEPVDLKERVLVPKVIRDDNRYPSTEGAN